MKITVIATRPTALKIKANKSLTRLKKYAAFFALLLAFLIPAIRASATAGVTMTVDNGVLNNAFYTHYYALTFATAQTNLTATNFTLTGTVPATITNVTGSGTSWTVQVTINSSFQSQGTLTLNMVNNTGLTPGVSGLPIAGPTISAILYPATGSFTLISRNANPGYAKVGDELDWSLNGIHYAPEEWNISVGGNLYASGSNNFNNTVGSSFTANSNIPQGPIGYNWSYTNVYNEFAHDSGTSSIVFDSVNPTVTVGSPSVPGVTGNATSPVSYTINYADANFNQITLSTANITLNKTGTANGVVSVNNSGTTSTVTLNGIIGAGTLGISIGAGTASDMAGNRAPASGASPTFNVVSPTTPTTTSISSSNNPSYNSSPNNSVVFTANVFSTSTVNEGTVTFTSNGAAIAGGSGVAVSNGIATFSTSFATTGSYTILATYNGSINFSSGSSNSLVQRVNPHFTTINSITANSANSNAGTIQFTVNFVDWITGLSASNFSLTTAGVTGASIASVSPSSGSTYTVTVNTGSGNGTIGLNLANGTGLSSAISTSLPFTGNTTTIDHTAPTVLSITATSPSNASPTNANPLIYTVTFSEPVTGVDMNAFTANTNGTTNAAEIDVNQVSPSVYNVDIYWDANGCGTLQLSLDYGGNITDLAGNTLSNTLDGDTYTIDNLGPNVNFIKAVTPANTSATNVKSATYLVSFSESVKNVTANVFKATTNGGVTTSGISVSPLDGADYRVTVSGITGNGTLRLDLNTGTNITDLLGNPIQGGFASGDVYTIDQTPPAAPSLFFVSSAGYSQDLATDGDAIFLNATYSEAVQPPVIIIGGKILTPVHYSGNLWGATYTVTAADVDGGKISFDIKATDLAGNINEQTSAGTGKYVTIDNSPPVCVISSPSASGVSNSGTASVSYTVNYKDANLLYNYVDQYGVTLNTTGTATGNISTSNDGVTCTVTISNITGVGTLGISVSPYSGQDLVGHYDTNGGTSATFNVGSGNTSLSNLSISGVALTPSFDPGTTAYTVSANSLLQSVTVTPVTADSTATVTVNGTSVAPSSASGAIALSVGTNTIITIVTAQDGVDTQTYTITVNVILAPPAFNYAGAQTYQTNTAITPLVPINTGGKVDSAGLPLVSHFAGPAFGTSGFSNPTSVATDAQGNVYVADQYNNVIRKITPAGEVTNLAGNGTAGYVDGPAASAEFHEPKGVAVDAQGNVYVADNYNPAIRKITPDGTVSTFAGSATAGYADGTGTAAQFNFPYGVAVDPQGNVFVADLANKRVRKITPAGVVTTFAGGGPGRNTNGTGTAASFSNIYAVATDKQGNVYVADVTTSQIRMITPAGLTSTLAGAGVSGNTDGPGTVATFNFPSGLSVDAQGNVYVGDQSNNSIRMVTPAGVVSTLAGTASSGSANGAAATASFNGPVGTATDYNGNVYVADFGNRQIRKITRFPYSISPALPAGLTFNNTTGVITGTPTTLSAATTYTVAATNTAGTAYTTVNITVTRQPDVSLSALQLSAGLLSPVFGSTTTNYTASVANTAASITVTPTVSDPTTTIKVNGIAVPSGAVSAPISLAFGANTVNITTLAADSITKKTYTVTVTRLTSAPSANLTNLKTSVGTLSPVFAANTNSYTVGVSNATTGITLTPMATATQATVTVNGVAVTSGAASQSLPLVVGSNVIHVVVTAQTGTVKTYTVVVTRAKSANAALSSLTASVGVLSPVFDPATLNYTDAVSNATTSIHITPTVSDAAAHASVNGLAVTSGAASAAIPLSTGNNKITIAVIAADGTTTQNYTVTVARSSSNANLAGIGLSTGVLSPAFVSSTTVYTASVSYGASTIMLTPTTSDAAASVTVNGVAVASGSPSSALPMQVGNNLITIRSIAFDGTAKTYKLTVTRVAPDASLISLALSTGTLTPAFVKTTFGYTAAVSNTTTSVKITPTATDPFAAITINGSPVTSGTESANLPLATGNNVFNTVVTEADGVTTSTYTIMISRTSSNANLAALSLSAGTLSPVFATGTTVYGAAIPNTVTSIMATPTTSDAAASVTVNGTAVPSGSPSAALPMVVGSNVVTVRVVAFDGTAKTYKVTVTRAKSADAMLSALSLSTGALSPVFAAGVNNYTVPVGNTVTSTKVTPVTNDAGATVKVNGVTVASGAASAALPLATGNNTINVVVTAADGISTSTYSITVARASSNANLLSLALSAGTLSPAFTSATTAYTASVDNGTTSITATPATSDAAATVNINGAAVVSGSASAALPLAVGSNTITVKVTAFDGTAKTYKVTVTRATGAIGFAGGGNVTTSFVSGVPTGEAVYVHSGVSPNGDGLNDFLVIDGITAYSDNTLSIMNRSGQLVFEMSGYDNSTRIFDGHSNKNGKLQQAGTYFYSLQYKVGNATKHKTGYIILKY